MTVAARTVLYDSARKVFTSGAKKQVSWASQAWMIHAGVVTGKRARMPCAR